MFYLILILYYDARKHKIKIFFIFRQEELFFFCEKSRPVLGTTGFSRFPCVYKRMLRWFPTFQVATTCFSCSPPDLNLLDPHFIFMYMHKNYCYRTTVHWQLNILLYYILCKFIGAAGCFLGANHLQLVKNGWRCTSIPP